MTIQANKVITINYTLRNQTGDIIDQSLDGSFCYLHGAHNIIPGLEDALHGRKQGDSFSVTIAPETAYGTYNQALTQTVGRDMFEPGFDIQPGMQFHAQAEDGRMLSITVTEVNGDQITIDGNHPLAGVTLYYDVQIVDVRDASATELQHGHVHQAHSHGGGCGGGGGGGCGSGGCGGGGCH
jgi:FKBP-type peptidyl-prolyl cis-trans isomerase SlyD